MFLIESFNQKKLNSKADVSEHPEGVYKLRCDGFIYKFHMESEVKYQNSLIPLKE